MLHLFSHVQRRLAFAAALVSSASLVGASATQATVLPVQGGPGGRSFSAACPADQFLVDVSVTVRASMDALFPLCAPFLTAISTPAPH
jgi:hypothetical protein